MARETAAERQEREAARLLTEVSLACRDFRHAWNPTNQRVIEQGNIVERTLSCLRCKNGRVDFIVRRTGELVGRRYDYPEKGFTLSGHGRISLQAIRRESIDRLIRAAKEATT